MSALSNQLREAGTVVGAVDAVGNVKALGIDLVGGLAGIFVFGLFLAMAGNDVNSRVADIGYWLGAIIGLVAWNAAGVVLMDEVSGGATRPTPDALVAGAIALVKGIVVFIAALLGVLIISALVAALLFVCKIPGVGPLLFFFVFPAGVVLMGVLLTAFIFLLLPVAAPAIWSGESIGTALARVIVVVKERLLGVLIRNIALVFLILIAGLLLLGIVISGIVTTGGMSAGILHADVNVDSLGSMFGGGFGGGYGRSFGGRGSGYVMAGAFGALLLALIVWTLPGLMWKKGWCLIYRDVVQDADVSAVEAKMQQRMAQVRQKANAARDRVQQQDLATRAAGPAAAQGRGGETQSEPRSAPVARARAAPPARTCPSCQTAIQSGDAFCGSCGFKLT